MFLSPHQMYLESQGLYQKICRLAKVRVEIKALLVEEDRLVKTIFEAMCPATEMVDLTFLRTQKNLVGDAELAEMFVARWDDNERHMTVHPAYVSDRFRLVSAETENEEERSKEEDRDVDVIESEDHINVKAFITFFNQVMETHHAKIPRIVSLNGNRLKALKARCHEFSKEKVVEVIQKAAVEPFLNGAGDKGWVASLDWLLKPNTFSKVLEGFYIQFQTKSRGLSPERIAMNREIERQQHEELHRRLDEQRRGAVTYEEYVRMRDTGEL